jgi:hypothetical protein
MRTLRLAALLLTVGVLGGCHSRCYDQDASYSGHGSAGDHISYGVKVHAGHRHD